MAETQKRKPANKGQSKPKARPVAGRVAPPEEEIRRRAYELYLERGEEPGHELEDWTRAERELRGDR